MAKNADFYSLFDNVYAVKFRYHMVTDTTLNMALPSKFMRQLASEKLQVKFAAESQAEAGTKRADCREIGKIFPAEVALLSGQVDALKDYVIFKVQ